MVVCVSYADLREAMNSSVASALAAKMGIEVFGGMCATLLARASIGARLQLSLVYYRVT